MPRPNLGPRLVWLKPRKSYYIFWYDQGQLRKRSTGTADSKEAEKIFAKFLGARHRTSPDEAVDPSEFLIADALNHYMEKHAPTVASPERIGYAVDALLGYWSDCMVAEVTKQSCQSYAKHRDRSAGTVRRELSTLRAAINFAYGEGLISRTVPLWLPKSPPGRDRWLNRQEAAKLLNAARTARGDVRLYLPLFIVIALYSGARKEAILSLRWSQVDLVNRRINFNNGTITNKRRAHIPITRQLMTFLALAARRSSVDSRYVIHDNGARILDIGDAKSGSFGSACRRAGLTGVTPHTLRHTCGTWLAQKGVSLFVIGGWLGHTDAHTTSLYAHHHHDHLGDALNALEGKIYVTTRTA